MSTHGHAQRCCATEGGRKCVDLILGLRLCVRMWCVLGLGLSRLPLALVPKVLSLVLLVLLMSL